MESKHFQFKCPNCGTPMRCLHCGVPYSNTEQHRDALIDGQKYCGVCGEKIANTLAEALAGLENVQDNS